jgi:hypothetical protein
MSVRKRHQRKIHWNGFCVRDKASGESLKQQPLFFRCNNNTIFHYLGREMVGPAYWRQNPASATVLRLQGPPPAVLRLSAGATPGRVGPGRPVLMFIRQKPYIQLITNPSEAVQWLCAHNKMCVALTILIFWQINYTPSDQYIMVLRVI